MKRIPLSQNLTFDALVASIQQANDELTKRAKKAVNVSLTVRNWLIGYYIAEFELGGADRADYGQQLLPKLSQELRLRGRLVYIRANFGVSGHFSMPTRRFGGR